VREQEENEVNSSDRDLNMIDVVAFSDPMGLLSAARAGDGMTGM
jgi:hypothetical protein